jgi:hypothetical protein
MQSVTRLTLFGSDQRAHFVTNRPPRKCLPLNSLTPCLGAVKLTKTSGFRPTPALLPSSTSQPEGTSTETIGSLDSVMSLSASSKGALTGPLKEKPVGRPDQYMAFVDDSRSHRRSHRGRHPIRRAPVSVRQFQKKAPGS